MGIPQHCRIQVWFQGHRPLDYRAEVSAAQRFAEALRGFGARVTIDTRSDPELLRLRPLPCERLWTA